MNRYTVTQVCEMFGVKSDTINGYRTGRSVRRNGRVEWTAPAILDTTDYERVIENRPFLEKAVI